ncbi:HlyD family secretion protein, partial [Pseudomonas sp. FG1]|nr:HlyD family secretion protein [Pseudomonas sp. FG1]
TEPNTPANATPAASSGPPPAPVTEPPSTQPRPLRVRIFSSLIFGSIALIGILIVLYAWQLPPFSSAIESTENALVRGQVTIIGPQLSGYVY